MSKKIKRGLSFVGGYGDRQIFAGGSLDKIKNMLLVYYGLPPSFIKRLKNFEIKEDDTWTATITLTKSEQKNFEKSIGGIGDNFVD